ncbi:DUF4124 domain-containing protein [Stutzerimonas stutzeri]
MRNTLLLLLVLFLPSLTMAQIYRWVDSQGNVHFEARPRPGAEQVEVRPQVIERDEATRNREARVERFFDARRQEQQRAEQAVREQQALREQACRQWREELASLSRGGRYFRSDAKGERVYYSEKEISAARQQLIDRINAGCS